MSEKEAHKRRIFRKKDKQKYIRGEFFSLTIEEKNSENPNFVIEENSAFALWAMWWNSGKEVLYFNEDGELIRVPNLVPQLLQAFGKNPWPHCLVGEEHINVRPDEVSWLYFIPVRRLREDLLRYRFSHYSLPQT